MIDKASLGITPEVRRDADYENAKAKGPARGDLPDFEKLVSESNAVAAEEREKEKVSNGGKELRLGETKSDAEFRERLEKITGKKQDKAKNKLDKDDYLTLMVTQMKMQDPTKPMDNQEMVAQLAQFNSVEQLLGINKQLAQLTDAQNASKGDKLTQYLGMGVQVAGSNLKVAGDGSMNEGFFEIPTKAGSVVVDIKDNNGTVVRSLKLGTLEQGSHKVEWDGKGDKGEKVAPGEYTFNINASGVDGKPMTSKTSMSARVNGITNITEGGKLDTTAGSIDPKNIIAVRAPAPAPQPAQPAVAATTPQPAQPAVAATTPQPAQPAVAATTPQPAQSAVAANAPVSQGETAAESKPTSRPAAPKPAGERKSDNAPAASKTARGTPEEARNSHQARSTKDTRSRKGDSVT